MSAWQRFLTIATSSAVAPPAPPTDSASPPELPAPEAQQPGTTTKVTKTTTTPSANSGFPNWMLWAAMVLWFVACVAGTFGSSISSLPHEAFIQLDGKPVATCAAINPVAVEANPTVELQWCTTDEVLGNSLPDDVEFIQGDVDWEQISWAT